MSLKLDNNVFAMAQDLYVRASIGANFKIDAQELTKKCIAVSCEFYAGWDQTKAQLDAFEAQTLAQEPLKESQPIVKELRAAKRGKAPARKLRRRPVDRMELTRGERALLKRQLAGPLEAIEETPETIALLVKLAGFGFTKGRITPVMKDWLEAQVK